MTDETTDKPFLCSACEARAELRVYPDGRREVACTGCDATEDYETVRRDVAEQAKEYMLQRLRRGFSKPGSKWKITERVRPKRVYRFFVEFETHGDEL